MTTQTWHLKQLAPQCMSRLLVAILSTSLLGCASPNTGEPANEDLHATLERLAVTHHVCGVAIAVIKNRQLDAMDFATGCKPALTPNANSIFQAASLSKPVFAYEVLKLVEQGKLELDAPVMRYLPQGYLHRFHPLDAEPSDLVADPRIQGVTVRMLLNHTSGLPNWASGPLGFASPPGAKMGLLRGRLPATAACRGGGHRRAFGSGHDRTGIQTLGHGP